jgi:hypothetical protein
MKQLFPFLKVRNKGSKKNYTGLNKWTYAIKYIKNVEK